jgi:hypothetical protein
MPCDVLLKNSLEPVRIEESFRDCTNTLNNAAQRNMAFVVCTHEDGSNLLINMTNILTLREVEPETPLNAI